MVENRSTFSNPGNIKKTASGTSERLVAFLDIMGFKDMVARQKETNIERKLYDLSEFITKNVEREQDFLHFIFSDSIILFASNDDLNSIFVPFLNLVGKIVEHSISLGLPIKGAVAKGMCTVAVSSKPFYFGQPIIDAYLLEENIVMYGVALHNSVEELSEMFIENCDRIIADYDIVLKGGHSMHYIVNWAKNNFDQNKINIRNIRKSVSDSPRRYVDNTLAYIEAVRK